MPFADPQKALVLGRIGQLPEPTPEGPAPAFWDETLPAAFRTENTVGSVLSMHDDVPLMYRRDAIDPDFDPFDGLQGTAYEPHLERFAFANSDVDVLAVKKQLDREMEDRKTIERAGWTGVAAMFAAGAIDPVNLIPVGGTAVKTAHMGGRILDGALRTARAGLLSSTAAEAVLQQTQLARTPTEGAANIAVATFLSGVLGGSTAAVRQWHEGRAIGRLYDDAMADPAGGVKGDRQAIALGDLEEGLDRVFVDRGLGELTDHGDGLGVVKLNSDGTMRDNSGSMDLKVRSGLVKIIWTHGEKSKESPHWQISKDDLLAMPDAFRRFKADKIVEHDGTQKWQWVVDRSGRRILYSVKTLTKNDGLEHLVTAHVVRKPEKVKLSEPRFKLGEKFKRAGNPESSPLERGKGEIPQGGVPINAPKGQDASAPKSIIAGRDPFATQAEEWADLQARVDDDLTVRENDPVEPGSVKLTEDDLVADTDSTAGAAQVRRGDEKMKSAFGVDKAMKEASPLMRTALSDSVETRRATQGLVETPFYYEKNAEGIASDIPVEAMVRRWQANLADGMEGLENAFVKYRTGQSRSFTNPLVGVTARDALPGGAAKRGQALDWKAFREHVGYAMRRNDTHPVPEVAEAARAMRETVFDPLKDEAIKVGLLPEDVSVDTALSYLMRVYDVEQIVKRRPEFVERVTSWLQDARDTAAERLEAREKDVAEVQNRLEALPDQLERARNDVTATREAWKQERKRVAAAERNLSIAKREARTAETERYLSANRAKKFAPTQELDRSDPMVQALQDMRRRGSAKSKPQSLTAWLVQQGGLREDAAKPGGGELKHMDITSKTRPGLINNKSGMAFDDAALRAWEEGFFPTYQDRPDIDTFLWALRDDVNGTPVVREADLDRLAYDDYLIDLENSVSELGLDPTKATAAEVEAAFAAAERGSTKSKYRKATPAARAKSREIAFYERRATKRVEKTMARLEEAHAAREKAIQARNDARDVAAQARRAFNALDDQNRASKRQLDTLKRAVMDEKAFATAEDVELKDIADQITNTVTGAPEGRIPYEKVQLSRGPLKERTFSIPDVMIEDFLISDIDEVTRRYVRTMAPDVELAKKFVRPDMADAIDKIKDDYVRKLDQATSERQRVKLDKAMRADIRDVEAMRDRLRGTYGQPADPYSPAVRTARVVRDWNFLRLLGGMTLSALPDMARPVMVHGLERTFKSGLVPLVTNMQAIKMAGREAKMAGTALDMVLNSRAMNLAELGDDFSRRTKFESGLRGLSDNFGVVSLMSPWNAAMKQWVGAMSGTRILQESTNWTRGRIRAANRETLAMLGVDGDMADRIAGQFAEFGHKDGGVWIAGTERWTDGEAVNVFRAALAKDVDRIIVTPGVGDRPLWMSGEVGKTIGQFKSFSIASAQRVLLAGLQQRDAAALNGAMLMTTLGMGVYAIKSWQGGYPLSDKPQVWIAEGIDRSGLTGWFYDVNNMAERTLGVGINHAIGGHVPSRYAMRNTLGTFLGPSAGTAQDVFRLGQVVTSGDPLRASDVRAARRLGPYQNVFYMRGLFDRAERGLIDILGAKGR